jgi:sodium-dependent dicarboxylate transporter 2/3/5
MMMVPIAFSVILELEDDLKPERARKFSCGLLLGIAYAASIGGIATLVGTPPNLAFARILQINFPRAPEISFSSWFFFAFPLSLVFFIMVWLLLMMMFHSGKQRFRFDQTLFKREYENLGPMTFEQRVVLMVFALLAFLWMTRNTLTIGGLEIPGWSALFPRPDFIDDGTVAVAMALLLFLLPARGNGGKRIMDWRSAAKLPWGIVLLFGGGFALAAGFQASGLSGWIGQHLTAFEGFPVVLIVLSVCTLMTFVTELTSNTATTQMILPILAAMSLSIGVNPLLLMIPATLSASCAFMLPVATPPNAVVFGTGRLKVIDMVRVGIIFNILGIILITAAIYLLGPLILGIDLAAVPEWAGK